MKLKKLIKNLDIISIKNFKNYDIKSITHISDDVDNSSMFICLKGNNFDGNDFVENAIQKGAKCLVTEYGQLNVEGVTIIVVKNVRIAMSILAKDFYDNSCDEMKIIGVVGTSGKTTTTYMIAQILHNIGVKVGVIGTNGIFVGNIAFNSKFTTPDPLDLHYIFYQMKMLGVEIVIMEVSAQAIFYNKVYGITFDVCVFTNISREHLDFFGIMEKYAKVKMDFFSKKNMKECVVNIDDFFGRELAYKVDIPCVSYGIKEPANSFAIDTEYFLDRTTFVCNIIDDIYEVNMPFVSEYNVYNFLACLSVVKLLRYSSEEISYAIKNLKEIDGRFNVYVKETKTIIIDFAHTPSSIDKLLKHVKEFCNGKIVSLFGCVGYSDSDKRKEMAEAVARYSDYCVVSSDNPGTTKFADICKDIIDGLGELQYLCIEDRAEAIKEAYKLLNENDVLVLIGKGAENFQTIGTERVPYSDKECVLNLIKD